MENILQYLINATFEVRTSEHSPNAEVHHFAEVTTISRMLTESGMSFVVRQMHAEDTLLTHVLVKQEDTK